MKTRDYAFEIKNEAATLSVGDVRIDGSLTAAGYCIIGWKDTSSFEGTKKAPVSETLSKLDGLFKGDATKIAQALEEPFDLCWIVFQYEGKEHKVPVSITKAATDAECLISLAQ